MDEILPPNSIEAEEACLGCILIDPRAIHEISGFLHKDDFYRDTNKTIYDSMLTISNKNEAIDLVSLIAELERRGVLEEVGGHPFLIGLANAVSYTFNIETYAKIVHSRAISRKMIWVGSAIANLAHEEEDNDARPLVPAVWS